jgi:long-subunit acyl-CoA synthetase (AMP-forming)
MDSGEKIKKPSLVIQRSLCKVIRYQQFRHHWNTENPDVCVK